MDYRCPACARELRKRKLTQAVIARMEIDCPHCKSRIRLNLHQAEVPIAVLGFGSFVLLGAIAYWMQSERLMLGALGAFMAAMLASYMLEQVYLRTWRRYAAIADQR